MAYLVRCWIGTAAVGAGLIHLGVSSRSPAALLVLLAVVGVVEVVWGVVTLARTAVPAPRLSLGGVLVPLAVQVVALLVAGGGGHAGHGGGTAASASSGFDPAAMVGASVLDLAVAVGLAIVLRNQGAPAREPGAAAMLLGLGAGGAVVALVVVRSLAALAPAGMGGMGGMTH